MQWYADCPLVVVYVNDVLLQSTKRLVDGHDVGWSVFGSLCGDPQDSDRTPKQNRLLHKDEYEQQRTGKYKLLNMSIKLHRRYRTSGIALHGATPFPPFLPRGMAQEQRRMSTLSLRPRAVHEVMSSDDLILSRTVYLDFCCRLRWWLRLWPCHHFSLLYFLGWLI